VPYRLCEQSSNTINFSPIAQEALHYPDMQVGEFAFVLLSLAGQLGLISNRLGMLLTTPLVLSLTLYVLNPDAAGAGLPYTMVGNGTHGHSAKHSNRNTDDEHPSVGHLEQPSMSDPIPEADIRKLHARKGQSSGPTMEGVLQRRESSSHGHESWSPRGGDSQRQVLSRGRSQSSTRNPL
jgi:hypothetical protein